MAFVLGDRVLETTTTTGTGTITLAGAVSGYRAFSVIATANGDTFYYVIAGGTEWEVGTGTRVSSTTFSRSVISSSNANNLVNFSAGTKEVWMDLPARALFVASTQTTPAVTAGSGTFTSVASTVNKTSIGKLVFFQVHITITTNGTAGGFVQIVSFGTLPVRNTAVYGNAANTGRGLTGTLDTAGTMKIYHASDASYAGATGEVLMVWGFCEVA
jgi:hypothetical protein